MSDSSTQDIHPEHPELPADAAKATAQKKSAKKATKKVAKKTTKSAKKTAKKAAKKTAKKTSPPVEPQTTEPTQVELSLPPSSPPAQQVAPPTPEPTAPPEPTPAAVSPAPQGDTAPSTEQPTMGRVKGLGPVKKNAKQGNRSDRNNRRDQDEPRRHNDPDSPREGRKRGGNGRRGNKKHSKQDHQKRDKRNKHDRPQRERPPKREVVLTGDPVDVNGMLEIAPKGFGFLRVPGKNFEQCQKDVFVPPDFIRKHGLRPGVWIDGTCQEGSRGPQLTAIKTINEIDPGEAFKLPHFEELKAINPNRRIAFESTPDRFTTRVLDIISPVGRGQRGLIVSPPRSGKTTMLLHMAEAINDQYNESIHLIILLVDERPEEVTEFRRSLPGVEIYASSNDDPARNHARIAELCIERAKRLVEGGTDVLILMDSITRLARAYNNSKGGSKSKGRGYQSGGIVAGALEMPRRIFAAARNTREAGSLTILATALIQTNSRADEAIFQEFKGTGNMELVLDRRIAEQYIYPAVDIFKSGTRREELIMADHLLHKINLIRRGLAGHRPEEAMERLLFFLKKFPNNTQMLMEIKG
ncbi:MAG: transcription termination factor Rho [Verrucomicrobiae bacterium]|nr:transcription termination factor Rho [Verrucomicrobiae bacterium]NNJ42461.1 transcription termination factor Rho [Akkermansiaceae bacterium]